MPWHACRVKAWGNVLSIGGAVLARARELRRTYREPSQTMSDYYCRHRGITRETPTREEYIAARGADPDMMPDVGGGGLRSQLEAHRPASLAESFTKDRPAA